MSNVKRWIIIASSTLAVGGAGYGGYTQRHLLLGEPKPATAAAADGLAQGTHHEHDEPRPIALMAHEESDIAPLPGNPLRDVRVVRGNDEGAGEMTPVSEMRQPPRFGGSASLSDEGGGRSVLAPPPTMPADAEISEEAAPASAYGQQEPTPAEYEETATADEEGLPSSRSRFGHVPAMEQEPPQVIASSTPAPHHDEAALPPTDRFGAGPVGSGVNNPPAQIGGAPSQLRPLAPQVGDDAQLDSAIEGSGRPGDRLLDGPQSPAMAIEKIAPSEIQIGKPAKFDIKVRNVGQASAENVVVRDIVPQGTRLIETAPHATEQGDGSLVWQLGTMRPGEEKTVSLQLMPVGEGEIGSVATVMFAAQASARTTSTRPQLLLESMGPRQVLIGQTMKLQIRLSNPGTGAATRVVLEEDVPDGLVHAAGRALEFEAGTLKPGETRELELTLKADKAGVVQNVIRARAEAGLTTESRADIEVIAPQLAVAVDGPSKRYLERQATHEITISNPGTAPAKEIEMVAHLPKGLKFVSANNQGQYDAAGHAVVWSLEELGPAASGTVSVTTLPMDAGQQKIRVDSKANMNLAAAQEHIVEVEGLAALFFEVADAADPIEIGGETIYEVRVINQGSKTSTNIRVAAALPPGLKPLEAGGATAGVVQGQQVVFEALPRLAPKADALFRIRVQGLQEGDQRVRVLLASDEIPTAVPKEESTRVYADE